MIGRPDYFYADYRELGGLLSEMVQESEAMAHATPRDGMFSGYGDRLFAVVKELAAIEGGLRAAVISHGHIWKRA